MTDTVIYIDIKAAGGMKISLDCMDSCMRSALGSAWCKDVNMLVMHMHSFVSHYRDSVVLTDTVVYVDKETARGMEISLNCMSSCLRSALGCVRCKDVYDLDLHMRLFVLHYYDVVGYGLLYELFA